MRALLLTAGLLAPCGSPRPEPPTCEERAADDCPADAGCQRVTGEAIAADASCLSDEVDFCVTATDCDGAYMVFDDGAGTRWWFSSSCAPVDWTLVTPTEAENAALDAGACKP